jgi:hypothetical protein
MISGSSPESMSRREEHRRAGDKFQTTQNPAPVGGACHLRAARNRRRCTKEQEESRLDFLDPNRPAVGSLGRRQKKSERGVEKASCVILPFTPFRIPAHIRIPFSSPSFLPSTILLSHRNIAREEGFQIVALVWRKMKKEREGEAGEGKKKRTGGNRRKCDLPDHHFPFWPRTVSKHFQRFFAETRRMGKLCKAAEDGDKKAVERLLEEKAADVNEKDEASLKKVFVVCCLNAPP